MSFVDKPCRSRGFTLIELLVVIAIIAVLISLLAAGRAVGPRGGSPCPVHQQPEADGPGRQQLRVRQQLLPGGSYSGINRFNPPHWGTYPENFSCFVRMLPYFEQAPMYNAINFNLMLRGRRQPDGLRRAGQLADLPQRYPERHDPASRHAVPPVLASPPGWSFNLIDTGARRRLPPAPRHLDAGVHQLRRQRGHLHLRLFQLMPTSVLGHSTA